MYRYINIVSIDKKTPPSYPFHSPLCRRGLDIKYTLIHYIKKKTWSYWNLFKVIALQQIMTIQRTLTRPSGMVKTMILIK